VIPRSQLLTNAEETRLACPISWLA